MTIESFVIAYLTEALQVPVSGDVPNPTPTTFVTVEKTGSGVTNHVQRATLAVQSWAKTTAAAMDLNESVKAAMTDMLECAEIGDVELNTDYNHPDTATRHARYQALFDVVFVDLGG